MGKEEYSEPKQIRFDNTVSLSPKMLNESGLEPGENVVVTTETSSGKIVIERMKKGGRD